MHQNRLFLFTLAFLACVLWGSAFPSLKIGYQLLGLGPGDFAGRLIFAGYRFFLAGLMLFLFVPIMFGESTRVSRSELHRLAGFGVLNTGLLYTFFYNGLANTTAVKGSILNSTGIFFSVLLAHFAYPDDRMTWRKLSGVLLGLVGIIVVNYDPQGLTIDFTLSGEGLVLAAALTAAVGNIVGKNLTKRTHPFVITAYQMLFGSLFLIGFGVALGGNPILPFDHKSTTLLVYLAFLSASAFSLWYTVLKYSKVGEVSIYRFLIPVSGSILSVVLLPSEAFSWSLFLALVLVSMGIITVNFYRESPRESEIREGGK